MFAIDICSPWWENLINRNIAIIAISFFFVDWVLRTRSHYRQISVKNSVVAASASSPEAVSFLAMTYEAATLRIAIPLIYFSTRTLGPSCADCASWRISKIIISVNPRRIIFFASRRIRLDKDLNGPKFRMCLNISTLCDLCDLFIIWVGSNGTYCT